MLAIEVGTYLAGQGIGTWGTDIIESQLIDSPDHLVVLFPYGPEPPEFDHDSDLPYLEHPSLQVMVRDPDFDTAMSTAYDVFNALCAVRNTSLSGTWYVSIRPKQSPFQLPRDESNRVLIACNYRVSKVLSS